MENSLAKLMDEKNVTDFLFGLRSLKATCDDGVVSILNVLFKIALRHTSAKYAVFYAKILLNALVNMGENVCSESLTDCMREACEEGRSEIVKLLSSWVHPASAHFDAAVYWEHYEIAFWIYKWFGIRGYETMEFERYKAAQNETMERAARKIQMWAGPNILRVNGKKYPHDDPRSLYRILAEKSYNEDYLNTLREGVILA